MKTIKHFIFAFTLFVGTMAFAQAPEKMSYQAVIRNSANALVNNQAVGMKISILQGSAAGTAVYVETQTPTSNANGLVSLELGSGNVVSGTFATIDWSNGPFFIKTETDPTGGTTYSVSATSQLLSTPYALHAKNGIPTGGTANQVLAKVNGSDYNTTWVTPSAVNTGPILLVRATANSAQSVPFGSNTTPPELATCFGNLITNLNNAYNSTTGVFTAPSDGLYLVTIQTTSSQSGVSIFPYIDVNNDFVNISSNTTAVTSPDYLGTATVNTNSMPASINNRGQLTAQIYLTAGQVFSFRMQTNTSVIMPPVKTDGSTNFTIVKLL